jgi:peptidoglycan/LPS O-acetylase OafA/YrhL
VTVFFTLSGYLITSLLLNEFRAASRIDLRGFWRRRLYRIMPLFWTVSATCGLIGLATTTELGWQTFTAMLGSFAFVINWLMAFGVQGPGGVLGTNWSVAVEEQFYLLWPLVFILLMRVLRKERTVRYVVAGAAVILMVHRALMTGSPWWRIWFGTDTQADALLVGCAVALGFQCRDRVVSLAAGAVLALLAFVAAEGGPGTAAYLMPAVSITTALLLPYLHEDGGILARGPLPAIGRRSYGLYLWGGPIGRVAQEVLGLSGPVLFVVAIGGVFAVAELTYRFVEIPMRAHGRRRRQPATVEDSLPPILEAAAA